MNIKVEKTENNKMKLEITVSAEQFNESLRKAYTKNSKKFNIPGFRKGKAPMHLIEKMYGEGVFFEDAVNICCDATYPQAISENNIKPIDYPDIDVLEIGKGKDLVYTAEVTVEPEVELGEYKGLQIEKAVYPVTDVEIEESINTNLAKSAKLEEKLDGSIEDGNIAVIDFKGFVDEVAFEGGEGNDFELEIGSGTFIDTFEEQLIGTKVGEEKQVNVVFPAEYGRKDLNGKNAKFEVKINAIKVRQTPELNDEFVKTVSELETVEAYKNSMKTNLEKSNAERSEKEFEEALLNKVCENSSVEIPEVMITRETNSMIKDLEMKLKYQGLDLETYYQYTNNTEEKVREYMKETAAKRVLTELILNKIATTEGIEVDFKEVLEKAREYATQYGGENLEKTTEAIVKTQSQMIAADLRNQKVVQFLIENSKTLV
ncbi:MAG: trigger factor [Clostridium sp.]